MKVNSFKLLLAGTALSLFASSAQAASNEELEQRVKELEAMVQELAAGQELQFDQITPASGGSSALAPSKHKGFIAIPGTDTSIKFGAYVKLDATYDADGAYGNDFVSFGGIPLDGSTSDNQDGEFNMTAKQTRISMTTMTDTALGDLKVYFEGDFFESAASERITNRHGFGLRQAYGQLGNWTVGQTWTNFQDLAVYPGSLDLIGSVGTTHVRQPQIRYTNKIDDKNTFTVAIENPSGDINDTTGNSISTEQSPDLTASITHNDDWGHVSLRGMARQFDVTNGTTGLDEEEFGWAASLSGKVKVGGKDQLFGRYVFGDGVGRYLFEASGTGSAFTGTALEAQQAHGGYANYRHFWNDKLSSNLIFGRVSIDNDTNIVGTAVNETVSSAHINLIWQPVKKVKVGIEYMHGERELENGTEGDLDRFLTSFIYSF